MSIPSSTLNSILDDSLVASEWQSIIEATPPQVRTAVSAFVSTNLDLLVTRYVEGHLRDPDAGQFMVSDESRADVRQAVYQWVEKLLCDEESSLAERIAQQRAVGEMLARGNYPIQTIARGARKLRAWIISDLRNEGLSTTELLHAASYLSDLLGISIELRSASYVRDAAKQSRIDEAYRIHSLGQNIAMERERQRASLMEWGHSVLVDLHRSTSSALPRLGQSDFGLWLAHRAAILFEGAAEVGLIAEAVSRVDNEILPQLDPSARGAAESKSNLVEHLQADLSVIKFNVASLFEQHIEVENGRDALTRLLNRRFLPTVLAREIALHRRTGDGNLSVVILDVDHFKMINDTHGHDAGDAVLQQAAALVTAHVRPSDFVFRYGGEEILIVLVESDVGIAARVAEGIRRQFAATQFNIADGKTLSVTVSAGVAEYRGRPDYQPMLKAADEALYRAKHNGRNRVEVDRLT